MARCFDYYHSDHFAFSSAFIIFTIDTLCNFNFIAFRDKPNLLNSHIRHSLRYIHFNFCILFYLMDAFYIFDANHKWSSSYS